MHTEAGAWFAATRLLGKTSRGQADQCDVREWMAWLLDRDRDAYACNQYALRPLLVTAAVLICPGLAG